jgi:hypothetical protein
MPFTKPERTDLVVNITLAEIFLLLLFATWYSGTLKGDPSFNTVLEKKIARLEKENQNIKNDLVNARNQISDLKKRLDWWHTIFPRVKEYTSEGEARNQAGRGFTECQEGNNTLIHAYVIQGKISMIWDSESSTFSEWLKNIKHIRLKFGIPITDPDEINSFLATIRDYYQYRKLSTECRFDYQLTYATKEDYYDGRELFEHYFYPASITRATTGLFLH